MHDRDLGLGLGLGRDRLFGGFSVSAEIAKISAETEIKNNLSILRPETVNQNDQIAVIFLQNIKITLDSSFKIEKKSMIISN